MVFMRVSFQSSIVKPSGNSLSLVAPDADAEAEDFPLRNGCISSVIDFNVTFFSIFAQNEIKSSWQLSAR